MRPFTRILVISCAVVASAQGQSYLLDDLHRMLLADADDTSSVARGDLDGDGDLDLVMVKEGDSVRVYRNDGEGGFVDDPGTRISAAYPRAIELFDMEGDGDLDLFVATINQDRLYANNGAGTFLDVTSLALPQDLKWASCSAAADIDADGDVDLLIANETEVRQLYLNDGTGRFTEAPTGHLSGIGTGVLDLAFVDVDGDADQDLVIVRGNAVDDLLLNDGAGHFTPVSTTHFPRLIENTYHVEPADVDGDGDQDLWLGTETGLRLLWNDSTGHFSLAPASSLPVHPAVRYRGLSAGDVDGDGDADLVFAAGLCLVYCDPTVRVWLNDGLGNFQDVTATHVQMPNLKADVVLLVDLDADADLDVVLGRFGAQNLILRNLGGGHFRLAEVRALPFTESTTELAVGDLDGDGDLDALLGKYYEQERIYRNDGHGLFAALPANATPTHAEYTFDVALADLEGDGDLDALIADWGTVSVWANRGNAMFDDVSASSPTLTTMWPRSLATGDVDGDGDVDVIVGCDGLNRLLVNDGLGVLTRRALLPGVVDHTASIELGDVDGDGDLDVVVGNEGLYRSGESDALLLNDGRGVFTDVSTTHFPTPVEATSLVRLGDVDGDGDLDLVTSALSPAVVRLHRNDGTGHLTDVSATALPTHTLMFQSLLLIDADGDGDLDMLGGSPQVGLVLWANAGAGTFVDVTGLWIPNAMEIAADLQAGDFDRDGDLDVFVANQVGDRVLTNQTRQLTWRTLPRVGRTLTLDARGPSNDVWFLSVALAPGHVPLPPFGTLYLDPVQLTPLGASVLDPLGRGSMRFAIPALPAYVGIPLYWQAAFLGAPRLSNLEVSVFEER